jgi:hypothetical protein
MCVVIDHPLQPLSRSDFRQDIELWSYPAEFCEAGGMADRRPNIPGPTCGERFARVRRASNPSHLCRQTVSRGGRAHGRLAASSAGADEAMGARRVQAYVLEQTFISGASYAGRVLRRL